MIPSHLRSRFDFLWSLPRAAPPAPWRKSTDAAVGGLTDVGFEASSDFLLVVSGQGRGVFDCTIGRRVARDDGEDYVFDTSNLVAEGIGPLKGKYIRMSGLHGGGLVRGTADGWSIFSDPTKWPETDLFLGADFQDLLYKPPGTSDKKTKLAVNTSELRAFRFSPTGRSFVIATSSDVCIFSRS